MTRPPWPRTGQKTTILLLNVPWNGPTNCKSIGKKTWWPMMTHDDPLGFKGVYHVFPAFLHIFVPILTHQAAPSTCRFLRLPTSQGRWRHRNQNQCPGWQEPPETRARARARRHEAMGPWSDAMGRTLSLKIAVPPKNDNLNGEVVMIKQM